MSELKLKPCPCCESDEVIYFKKTRNRGYVTCIACGMRTKGCGNYENKDDLKWRERATILWNRRKPVDNIVRNLDEKRNGYIELFATKGENELYGVAFGFAEAINIVKQEINNGLE